MHVQTGDAAEPGIDGGIWKGEGSRPAEGLRLNAFNCSIGVSNIDETLKKIIGAGGSIAKEIL